MIIRLNDKGDNVVALQELLNIQADGFFGDKTEMAVKEFQINNGLIVDGIVGDKTWEAINNLSSCLSDNSNLVPYQKHYLPINEYSKNKTKKEYLFLHHTSGWNNPFNVIDSWANDSRGMIGTEFVIGGQNATKDNDRVFDGLALQSFPNGHYAWHLGNNGNQEMHKNSIGIEICNFGYIQNNKIYTGKLAHYKQIVELDHEFRGFRYWHKYSDKQIYKAKELILYIAERDNIQVTDGLPKLIKEKGHLAFEFNENAYYGRIKGLWTHSNTRKDKFDCFPQQELMDMLISL